MEVHPPSDPSAGLDPHLTHKLEGSLAFDAKQPFSFLHTYTPDSRIPELSKEPKILPCGSGLQAFQLILDTASQTSEVSKSRTPEVSTLTRGDLLNVEESTRGSRVLHPPNGPSKKVPGVTRGKEEMTHGPYSG
jgi:hypothetical protein